MLINYLQTVTMPNKKVKMIEVPYNKLYLQLEITQDLNVPIFFSNVFQIMGSINCEIINKKQIATSKHQLILEMAQKPDKNRIYLVISPW